MAAAEEGWWFLPPPKMKSPKQYSLPDVAILCGGLGTRLRSVVSDRPKPMADIAGRPFLELLVRHVTEFGFKRIVLCVGCGADMIVAHFASVRVPGVSLIFSREDKQAGTGGALANACGFFSSDCVLAINGDTFCAVDYRRLLRVFRSKAPAALMTIVRIPDSGEYGAVRVCRNGKVTAFEEKGDAGEGWINAGVYVFPTMAIKKFPSGRPLSLEKEILPELAGRQKLWAYRTNGVFLDIGTPERYRLARKKLPPILT